MTIYFATDHAGFALKETLLSFVQNELGYETEDCGAYDYDEKDDYPPLIARAAREVAEDPEKRKGIILGGSGQGEAMVANRFKGVRATVYYGGSLDILSLSRTHNDANMLSLGARFLSADDAKNAVRYWLSLNEELDKRHLRRNALIDTVL